MSEQTYPDVNVQFEYAYFPEAVGAPVVKRMHYKAMAAYLAAIVSNPDSYRYSGSGKPYWNQLIETDVCGMRGDGSLWTYHELIVGTDMYPAAQYVVAAMRNARDAIVNDAQRWMTPAEVESELGLSSGTVRQYIFQKRAFMEEKGYIREADKRTVLILRGVALNRWGKRGEKQIEAVDGYADVIDIATDEPQWHNELPLRQEVYEALKTLPFITDELGRERTEFRQVNGKNTWIEKRSPSTRGSSENTFSVCEAGTYAWCIYPSPENKPKLQYDKYQPEQGDVIRILKAFTNRQTE